MFRIKFRLSTLKNILVTIIVIAYVKTQTIAAKCGDIQPYISTDCLKASDSNFYCCYKADDSQLTKSCTSILKSAYTPSQYFLNGKGNNLDCGFGSQGATVNTGSTLNQTATALGEIHNSLQLPMYSCGIQNPVITSDCTDYSILGNSCCYLQKGLNTGCYWLGQRFVGNATLSSYSITCNGKYLSFHVGLFFIFFFALLLN